jgi:enolase
MSRYISNTAGVRGSMPSGGIRNGSAHVTPNSLTDFTRRCTSLDFGVVPRSLVGMSTIHAIQAREVLDSRGTPTVEVEVTCRDESRGRAMVPSGASAGRHEALELRDGDPQRFGGRGCLRAVALIHDQIAPALLGSDVADQRSLDERMKALDGTPNKARLGANAILGVSLACAHAASAARRVPLYEHLASLAARSSPATLPLPMVNMISGGLHAGGNLDWQDVLLMPVGARCYREALEWISRVYRSLAAVLEARGYESVLVGDEGGFGPKLRSNEEAVELLVEAICEAQLEPGRDAAIAIDVASTHFYRDDKYQLSATGRECLRSREFVDRLDSWTHQVPIVSIEDGCAEDDWDGWRVLTERLGGRLQLIGDDLFVTNPDRLARGIAARVANAILIKPNQIGTLTETLDVIAQANAAGYRTIVSARSGETEDVTIAHLAVGVAAGQIKIGSIARSERLAKYNELLRIEERLGDRATLAHFRSS